MKAYFLQAYRGISSNKGRTFLTTLGIVIGIGTVVLVLSAGEGFKSYINSQVEAFGSNTIIVQTSVPPSTKARSANNLASNEAQSSALNAVPITTLKMKDVEDIKQISNVKNAYGASVGQQVVSYKNISKTAFIFGASSARFDIDKGVIAKGRGFSLQEDKSLAQVAVLGEKVANDLFGDEEPLNKFIKIGNYNFEVIGVYEHTGGLDPTNDGGEIVMPVTTLQKKIQGIDYLIYSVVELEDNNKADATALDIGDVLRRNHYI
ncbi:MAG: ABC transporter permease, partial [Gammaproteobacteria bacterium]